ncbi:hypothetical protein Syun_029961 [Stephania yunnanensis]|uniref:Uncharacterized protein n=1 Tax=Stephania yunnanensis TaxID=152371 RepID=A0AAP0HK17_9MAGN
MRDVDNLLHINTRFIYLFIVDDFFYDFSGYRHFGKGIDHCVLISGDMMNLTVMKKDMEDFTMCRYLFICSSLSEASNNCLILRLIICG